MLPKASFFSGKSILKPMYCFYKKIQSNYTIKVSSIARINAVFVSAKQLFFTGNHLVNVVHIKTDVLGCVAAADIFLGKDAF